MPAEPEQSEESISNEKKWINLPDDWWPDTSDTEPFAVLPENWRAFEVFLECARQWRWRPAAFHITPSGAIVPLPPTRESIDRTRLESVMRMMAVDDVPDTLQRVALIERGAIAAMDETPLDDVLALFDAHT